MHEITEASTRALSHLVLSTTRFTEVGDGGELCVYRLSLVPTVVDRVHRFLRVLFVLELDVYVSDEVIAEVVANIHLFDFAVLLFQLEKHIFEERIVKFLCLDIIKYRLSRNCTSVLCFVVRILKHVLKKYGLTERRFVVKSTTFIAVTTCTDLEVKRTIYFVLLRTEYRSKIFRHIDLNISDYK